MNHISEQSWSIGKKIFENFDKINSAKSKKEVEDICDGIVKGMNSSDSRKFMYNLRSCKNKDDAVSYCYNYYFAGLAMRV